MTVSIRELRYSDLHDLEMIAEAEGWDQIMHDVRDAKQVKVE